MVNGVFLEDEIELETALDLVRSGKSVFVWIGGWTNTPLAELLELDEKNVVAVEPYELLDSDRYPKELLKYDRPVFVCHHGISSYELVKALGAMGVKGYSLAGGIEGIKQRGQR